MWWVPVPLRREAQVDVPSACRVRPGAIRRHYVTGVTLRCSKACPVPAGMASIFRRGGYGRISYLKSITCVFLKQLPRPMPASRNDEGRLSAPFVMNDRDVRGLTSDRPHCAGRRPCRSFPTRTRWRCGSCRRRRRRSLPSACGRSGRRRRCPGRSGGSGRAS